MGSSRLFDQPDFSAKRIRISALSPLKSVNYDAVARSLFQSPFKYDEGNKAAFFSSDSLPMIEDDDLMPTFLTEKHSVLWECKQRIPEPGEPGFLYQFQLKDSVNILKFPWNPKVWKQLMAASREIYPAIEPVLGELRSIASKELLSQSSYFEIIEMIYSVLIASANGAEFKKNMMTVFRKYDVQHKTYSLEELLNSIQAQTNDQYAIAGFIGRMARDLTFRYSLTPNKDYSSDEKIHFLHQLGYKVILREPKGKHPMEVNIVLPDVAFISGRLATLYPQLVAYFDPYQSEKDEATHEENIEVFLKQKVLQSVKKGYVHDQFFHVIRQLGHLHELLGQDVKAAPFHPAFCEQVNKEIKRAYSVVAMTKENVDKASFASLNFSMLASDIEKLMVSLSYKVDIMTARHRPRQALVVKYNGDTLKRIWSTTNGRRFWVKSFNEPWSEASVNRLALLWDRLLNHDETKALLNRIEDDFHEENKLGLNEDILSIVSEIALMPALDAKDDFNFAKRFDKRFLASEAFQVWWEKAFPALSLDRFIEKRDEIWVAIEIFRQDIVRPSFIR